MRGLCECACVCVYVCVWCARAHAHTFRGFVEDEAQGVVLPSLGSAKSLSGAYQAEAWACARRPAGG